MIEYLSSLDCFITQHITLLRSVRILFIDIDKQQMTVDTSDQVKAISPTNLT